MTTEDELDKKLAEWKIQKDIEKQDIEQGITEPTEEELIEKYNVWKKTYNKNGEVTSKKANFPNLGELIFNALNYHFLTTRDNEEIYWYNGGYYEPNGEQIIKDQVEHFLGEDTTEHAKNEVLGYIRDKNYQDREILSPNIDLINLQNGVYNIMTQELTEHSPDYYFINELPVIYDKTAKCSKILEFIKDVVYPEDIPVIQEFFGYCIYRRYHIHKACMFLGGGRNGKSTALSLLKALLGEKIDIVNCESAIITGRKKEILERYREKREKGDPLYGPFIRRKADRFVKRVIRGMLPYKQEKGRKALKRIKCFIGLPEQFKDKKLETVKNASVEKMQNLKYLKISRVLEGLGK